MRDFPNLDWQIKDSEGKIVYLQSVSALLAVLMDIREELRRMNEVLYYRPPDTVVDIVRTLSEKKSA